MEPPIRATIREGLFLTEIRIAPRYIYSEADKLRFLLVEQLPKQPRLKPLAVVWCAWPKEPDVSGRSLVTVGEGHNQKLQSTGEPFRHKGEGKDYNPQSHALYKIAAYQALGWKTGRPTGEYLCILYTRGPGHSIYFQYPRVLDPDLGGTWITKEGTVEEKIEGRPPTEAETTERDSGPGWEGSGLLWDPERGVSVVEILDGERAEG